jgi:transposase InsO family protein
MVVGGCCGLNLAPDGGEAGPDMSSPRVRAMGIRDRPVTPDRPCQNGIAERLIGTLRLECLDQLAISGKFHLRRVLSAYATYYNQTRLHLALQKNAPVRRAIQRVGRIVSNTVLGGLHQQHVRM